MLTKALAAGALILSASGIAVAQTTPTPPADTQQLPTPEPQPAPDTIPEPAPQPDTLPQDPDATTTTDPMTEKDGKKKKPTEGDATTPPNR